MRFCVFVICFISFLAAEEPSPIIHSTIRAQYLTANRDTDKTHPRQYWEPIRKVSSGSFECRWIGNGDVYIKYSDKDKPTLLNRRDDLKKENTDSLNRQINGFKLYGIYSDPEQPPDLFYVFYIHPQKPNSVLIQFCSFAGYKVLFPSYFSDEMINPFEKISMIKNDGKTGTFKLN